MTCKKCGGELHGQSIESRQFITREFLVCSYCGTQWVHEMLEDSQGKITSETIEEVQ